MMNADVFTRVTPIIGQIVCEAAIQPDLAFVDKLKNQQSRELLCQRPDLEFRVSIVRNIPFAVCGPIAALVYDLFPPCDQDIATEITGLKVPPQDRIELGLYSESRGL